MIVAFVARVRWYGGMVSSSCEDKDRIKEIVKLVVLCQGHIGFAVENGLKFLQGQGKN